MQYTVSAKKKDGTTYEGIMTVKEPQLVNGLFAVANKDGEWRYIQPDELSEIVFTPVQQEQAETPEEETAE
ncbi:hypothetical protein [Cedecea colo]|uniref:Uncharacterized protein n=1 Tax=Cedecea colo TaxID=2552946 RepID=A0ABX0VL37_9ENTR|nr:hypothetical protein [Cedecea colo]NIY47281.1 hypothetical protein [Cedecea colo]